MFKKRRLLSMCLCFQVHSQVPIVFTSCPLLCRRKLYLPTILNINHNFFRRQPAVVTSPRIFRLLSTDTEQPLSGVGTYVSLQAELKVGHDFCLLFIEPL